jgi:hypothetical protein
MKVVRVSCAGFVAALVVAAPAFAGGDSTLKSGYGSTPHNVAGAVAKSPKKVVKKSTKHTVKASSPTVKSKGTLPFTGADLGFVMAGAVALTGTGLVFRRLGRQSN